MHGRAVVPILLVAGLCSASSLSAHEDARWLFVGPGADAAAASEHVRVDVAEDVALAVSLPAGASMRVDALLVLRNADVVAHEVVLRWEGTAAGARVAWITEAPGRCLLAPGASCIVGLAIEAPEGAAPTTTGVLVLAPVS